MIWAQLTPSLPGQRLSACTCKGEDHPGPDHTYGRGAPEIDIIEAQTDLSLPRGQVSQSAQIAPFDADYYPFNSTDDIIVYDTSIVKPNSYLGGVYQQAVSNLAYVQTANYQLTSKGFASYGEFWGLGCQGKREKGGKGERGKGGKGAAGMRWDRSVKAKQWSRRGDRRYGTDMWETGIMRNRHSQDQPLTRRLRVLREPQRPVQWLHQLAV